MQECIPREANKHELLCSLSITERTIFARFCVKVHLKSVRADVHSYSENRFIYQRMKRSCVNKFLEETNFEKLACLADDSLSSNRAWSRDEYIENLHLLARKAASVDIVRG